MKRILFIHNNYPAQFLHISRRLAEQPGFALAAIGTRTARPIPGVRLIKYSVGNGDVSASHPFARRFDLECRRAEEVLYAASSLTASGFVPDIIMAHPGWGETLPLRAVFPKAHLVTYCEFFYQINGQDNGFDPEFPELGIDGKVALEVKNATSLLALTASNSGISPTQWQRSTYPTEFQSKISVIHEGVNTDAAKPAPRASFTLKSGQVLTKSDEVVTFVARSFEPLRGFHVFLRALPRILAARPNARILIIGGEGTGYGASAPRGKSWRSIYLKEIAGAVDQSRIHFVGHLGHQNLLNAFQISSAHVYLTYPFVLSWSLMEAMSSGCVVIASATPPVQEVIDDQNGILVPFFDVDQLADRVIDVLAHPRDYKSLRARARATIVDQYDTEQVCLPKLLEFLALEPIKAAPSAKRMLNPHV